MCVFFTLYIYAHFLTHSTQLIFSTTAGNESGYGSLHDEMYQWLRRRDKDHHSRVIMYEPASYGPTGGGKNREHMLHITTAFYAADLHNNFLKEGYRF